LSIQRTQEDNIGSYAASSSHVDDEDTLNLARKTRQSLDDEEAAPAAEGDYKFETPDPEEAKKKAAEAMQGAGEAASKAAADAQKALMALLPVGDIFKALGWHLDFCFYLATMYAVYYVWASGLHWKILPRFEWAEDEKISKEDLHLAKHACQIENGWIPESEKDTQLGPNKFDLLWFRLAKGEILHFAESKRVLPGFVDTLMCGCGGNVFAFAVTSKRMIIQNDKRCLFGSTVLTTNEESFFLKDIHKVSLFTDGSLNLGICVLHSFDMLRAGFNWIFAGFIVDLVLEWKPAFMSFITDERLIGWINMVPNDVIQMVASLFVLLGGFFLIALLWFILVPQSTLEIEIVKQAGSATYIKKFECPVLEAYKAYDAIMSGRLDNKHRE